MNAHGAEASTQITARKAGEEMRKSSSTLVGRRTRPGIDEVAAGNGAPSRRLFAAAVVLRLVGLPVAGALSSPREKRLEKAARKG